MRVVVRSPDDGLPTVKCRYSVITYGHVVLGAGTKHTQVYAQKQCRFDQFLMQSGYHSTT